MSTIPRHTVDIGIMSALYIAVVNCTLRPYQYGLDYSAAHQYFHSIKATVRFCITRFETFVKLRSMLLTAAYRQDKKLTKFTTRQTDRSTLKIIILGYSTKEKGQIILVAEAAAAVVVVVVVVAAAAAAAVVPVAEAVVVVVVVVVVV